MDVLTHSILPFFGILLGLHRDPRSRPLHHGQDVRREGAGGRHRLAAAHLGLPLARHRLHPQRHPDWRLRPHARRRGPEADPAREEPAALRQPKWKRTVIIGAGVVHQLRRSPIVLFAIAGLMIPHDAAVGGARIATVVPDSPGRQRRPAAQGDQILEVNGRSVESQQDASYLLRLYQGSNIDFTLKRTDPRDGCGEHRPKSVYSRWNPKSYLDECGVKRRRARPASASLQRTRSPPRRPRRNASRSRRNPRRTSSNTRSRSRPALRRHASVARRLASAAHARRNARRGSARHAPPPKR